MFTSDQKNFIQSRGSNLHKVEQQIADFQTGFPFLNIIRPATIGDGIIQLSDHQVQSYLEQYESQILGKDLLKFVPASGAATRMFKDLFEFLATGELNSATENFIKEIKKFAFYQELSECLTKQGQSLEELLESENYKPIVNALLESEGLNYGSLPKGLLSFHSITDGAKTPMEEHLVEGAKYAVQSDGKIRLHFTVSPEHQERFQEKLAKKVSDYQMAFGVEYQVSFSQQKKSTDTIAVDLSNKPFFENGELLFRPAGHGALLENLNDLSADVIFIKNIDNVVPDHLKADTITYKKALASLLIDFQNDSFNWQQRIEQGEDCLSEALNKLKSKYAITPDVPNLDTLSQFLNRPVRVCGMVENTGEPGGGPFWVKDEEEISLQIAETAQIDLADSEQERILKLSSHFNPVDLVCGVRDYKGNKFELLKFRNDKTGFITHKSRSGKELKAMELPGLWNGAMADWITLFVEVPISTFNPVKTVNDLLKPSHQ
ncbi:MAG: DUF4301 family protein [Reichenbachiella sp.]|uniref:DUF4301 family protein n=1 Tax=Reichenbachiella sp. TaxID=2184521 RepID=UPI003263891D